MVQLRSAYPPRFDAFPSYKGGRTVEYNGYIWEFLPGHHLQNLWGFVPQHRLIAEDIIGRRLVRGEDVHHRDECRTNNDPANLQVMTQLEHRRHHGRKMAAANRKPLTREQVDRTLKDQGGIKPAARALGVSHSTLRLRFPTLCLPYQRTTPTKIDNPRDIEAILEAAENPNVGVKEIAKMLHMSAATILNICRRRGVPWVRKSKVGESHPTYRGKPTLRSSGSHVPGSEAANKRGRLPLS